MGGVSSAAAQDAAKPNILVIWGDDIGWYNISAYNLGVMGYRTPNIDRIAREGALFTDWYGQQSCTAGRAAFVTGQSPVRTGLTKVGLPGAGLGLKEEDPTIAGLLKNHGYMTGQYGKNHLGDRDEHMPTNHGFDEFFGNLYHLNAEEEPENPDYPKDPTFKERFGPRGVIKSIANPDGTQTIEDTGPLTRKRMETVDVEVTDGALDFIERAHAAGKPFFLWWNSTRMHIWTHLKPASQGVTGIGVYPDGMVEHDGMVGQLLDKLDELGIADNTIVMYSTDNGAEVMSWPDGGTTPFRGEKNTNWEGGYRVPALIRWPGVIEPGTIYNDVFAHEDMLPTLLAAAGEPDVKEELLTGHSAMGRDYKVHLDGYNLLPYFKGEQQEAPRREFLYWTDGGDLAALRYGQWKLHLPGAAGARLRRLGGAVRAAAPAEAVHPARRSVRARRRGGHRLRHLAPGARVRAGAGAGVRGELAAELQGVPAAPEAGDLRHRPGHGPADLRRHRQQLSNRRNVRCDTRTMDGHGLQGGRRGSGRRRVRCWAIAAAAQSSDPLPSWNDGPAKQAIVEFVEAVTTEGGADFVPPEDRIATFDQDGTLWVEHPIYTQVVFALDRVGDGAGASGVEGQGAVQGGAHGRPRGDGQVHREGLEEIVAATHAGMTTERVR